MMFVHEGCSSLHDFICGVLQCHSCWHACHQVFVPHHWRLMLGCHGSKVPFPMGDQDPIYHMVLWAHPTLHPKRHLDYFSRFSQLQCPNTLQWAAISPPKLPLSLARLGSLGPSESAPQTAPRSILLFLQGLQT